MVWGAQTSVPLSTPPTLRLRGVGRPGIDQAGGVPPYRTGHPSLKLFFSLHFRVQTQDRSLPRPPSWTGGKLRPGLRMKLGARWDLSWPGSAVSGDHLTPDPHVRLVPPVLPPPLGPQ